MNALPTEEDAEWTEQDSNAVNPMSAEEDAKRAEAAAKAAQENLVRARVYAEAKSRQSA